MGDSITIQGGFVVRADREPYNFRSAVRAPGYLSNLGIVLRELIFDTHIRNPLTGYYVRRGSTSRDD